MFPSRQKQVMAKVQLVEDLSLRIERDTNSINERLKCYKDKDDPITALVEDIRKVGS